ncbi:MAG TPA: hypothetical protein DEG17_04270 [Cyanobacteria bacterium UBA11149]|nr:hypothetical protein [Cyanobacteria bacterium UBA11366]HBK62164.1 hypothetical protein [Cyanobacteria bacterium UBA11166]HBR74392.1 hypothetical protein [Cyanobacteria bacterium UBA11159]HBS69497.1 hypothetical protein [Cyanobacteria bacterium UBA11153]HBW88105.1 hypothetical protein [Cyanobacteria bacterium UBA11149]HCA94405.1 hypothetical protein [Cyanobacteria bacterium UBA9226]
MCRDYGEIFCFRWYASNALGELGKNSEILVNALLLRLNDKNPYVRASAANALGNLGKNS